MIRKPFNLKTWIDENRHLLKPPVANKNLYPEGTDYIVMIVGGPNARKDFHYNETEELFYQLEGAINVRIQEDGKPVDIPIRKGEDPNMLDGLIWYCDKCNNKLHEYRFHLDNIEKDFLPRFREFYGSKELRTCRSEERR